MEQDWIDRCLKCRHSYFKKADADTMYCRCKNGKCDFKPKISKKRKKEDEK